MGTLQSNTGPVYFHTACREIGFPTSICLIREFCFLKVIKTVTHYRIITYDACLMQESEHSRGFTLFICSMANTQTSPHGRNATTIALRAAVMRVVKQRKAHRNFLKASAETEARLLEGQPSSIFMYGL